MLSFKDQHIEMLNNQELYQYNNEDYDKKSYMYHKNEKKVFDYMDKHLLFDLTELVNDLFEKGVISVPDIEINSDDEEDDELPVIYNWYQVTESFYELLQDCEYITMEYKGLLLYGRTCSGIGYGYEFLNNNKFMKYFQ